MIISFIENSHSRHVSRRRFYDGWLLWNPHDGYNSFQLSVKRQKRQHGAHLYLPASYVIPGGDDDPNDHWGPWGAPSECSRTCGGGVSYQTRECYDVDHHNQQPRCRGGSKKFFSCNTQVLYVCKLFAEHICVLFPIFPSDCLASVMRFNINMIEPIRNSEVAYSVSHKHIVEDLFRIGTFCHRLVWRCVPKFCENAWINK